MTLVIATTLLCREAHIHYGWNFRDKCKGWTINNGSVLNEIKVLKNDNISLLLQLKKHNSTPISFMKNDLFQITSTNVHTSVQYVLKIRDHTTNY